MVTGPKNPPARLARGFSLLLALIYTTTQVALASHVEANFWEQRRKTRSSFHNQNSPAKLASLPTNFITPNSKNLLNQLSPIKQTLPHNQNWAGYQNQKYGPLPSKLKSLIEAIPVAHSNIQEVYDSGNRKFSPILIIQDVHLNSEAQQNIAAILQELINQKQVDLIGVEGAFGPFYFSRFRAFPQKEITKYVSDSFLEKNLLAAPSYVGITSPIDLPLFVGVDDEVHYNANVQAYLDSRPLKKMVSRGIEQQKRNLAERKANTLSPELKEFDDSRIAYHNGNLGFGAYVKKLASYQDPSDLAVQQFLEAYDMERTLNFPQIEEERKIIIEQLTKALSESELNALVAHSLAYRMGRTPFGRYYNGLKDLCKKKGIDLRQTPSFEDYIRYVLLSDGIKSKDLFDSVERLEEEVIITLVKTNQEKELIQTSKNLSLSEKLIDFSLSPMEWQKLSSENQRTPQANLNPFKEFYKQADIRSKKMVKSLLDQKAEGTRVLVTGGFHTPDVTHLLKKQNVSFIVVSPKISKVDTSSGSSYLSVFARETTPLDQLFEGQKLFINPRSQNVSYLATAIRWMSSVMARIGENAKKSFAQVRLPWKGAIVIKVKKGIEPANDQYSIPSFPRWLSLLGSSINLHHLGLASSLTALVYFHNESRHVFMISLILSLILLVIFAKRQLQVVLKRRNRQKIGEYGLPRREFIIKVAAFMALPALSFANSNKTVPFQNQLTQALDELKKVAKRKVVREDKASVKMYRKNLKDILSKVNKLYKTLTLTEEQKLQILEAFFEASQGAKEKDLGEHLSIIVSLAFMADPSYLPIVESSFIDQGTSGYEDFIFMFLLYQVWNHEPNKIEITTVEPDRPPDLKHERLSVEDREKMIQALPTPNREKTKVIGQPIRNKDGSLRVTFRGNKNNVMVLPRGAHPALRLVDSSSKVEFTVDLKKVNNGYQLSTSPLVDFKIIPKERTELFKVFERSLHHPKAAVRQAAARYFIDADPIRSIEAFMQPKVGFRDPESLLIQFIMKEIIKPYKDNVGVDALNPLINALVSDVDTGLGIFYPDPKTRISALVFIRYLFRKHSFDEALTKDAISLLSGIPNHGLNDPNERVQIMSFMVLFELDKESMVRNILETGYGLTHENIGIRQAVAEVLAQVGLKEVSEETAQILLRPRLGFKDEDPEVRKHIALAMGSAEGPLALRFIDELTNEGEGLFDENDNVAVNSARSLGNLLSDHPEKASQRVIRRLFRHMGHIWWSINKFITEYQDRVLFKHIVDQAVRALKEDESILPEDMNLVLHATTLRSYDPSQKINFIKAIFNLSQRTKNRELRVFRALTALSAIRLLDDDVIEKLSEKQKKRAYSHSTKFRADSWSNEICQSIAAEEST